MDQRDLIIQDSIHSLQEEGLRFSVDSLASRLRISKKTIYKYFPTKDALAKAIYETYFGDACRKAESTRSVHDLLSLFFQTYGMINGKVFNKYALNESIKTFAQGQLDALWSVIEPRMGAHREAKRWILEGTFEYVYRNQLPPKEVLAVLEEMVEKEESDGQNAN